MVDYPYGRSGTASLCVYQTTVGPDDLLSTKDDDEAFEATVDGVDVIIRYEAPRDDDPARGHLSIWRSAPAYYERAYTYTGDDGDVYRQYQTLEADPKDVSSYLTD